MKKRILNVQQPASGVVGVCIASLSGADHALAALQHVTGAVRHITLADPPSSRAQMRGVIERIAELRPKTVILGGWSAHYGALLRHFRRSGPFWAVYWTEGTGQIGVASDIETFVRVLADRRIGAMLYADASLAASAVAALKPSDVLPVCTVPVPQVFLRARKGTPVISLFCSEPEVGHDKALSTLLALADVRRKFVLHLNGLSRQGAYRRLLQQLQIPYRELGSMKRGAYERAVADADIGLQLSSTDNQVVADHGWRGIPVIASAAAPAVRHLAPALRARLAVVDTDDSNALREKVEYLLVSGVRRARLGAAIRRQLVHDNVHNIRTAAEVLKTLG